MRREENLHRKTYLEHMSLKVLSCHYHKNIKRHTADTIVSLPNPKQWVIVHTSDFMMIIRQSKYIIIIYYHNMETRCTLLAHRVENPPVTSGLSSRNTRNAELWCFLFHQLLNKQSICWWFVTPWRSLDVTVTVFSGLGRQCMAFILITKITIIACLQWFKY